MTRKSTKKNKEGRPTVMTQETIQKLEQAFAFGSTDEEACFYANIGKSTLYDYIKANPEFSERKEALKLIRQSHPCTMVFSKKEKERVQ
jgi:Ca2+-binding EF-hand superfamily protein